jgi:hypothetical protein
MVPMPDGQFAAAASTRLVVAEGSTEVIDIDTGTDTDTTRTQHGITAPEDYRYNHNVLKTMITPTFYGILLKTHDNSSNTPVFVSVVSHSLCHDAPSRTDTSNKQQRLVVVNPRCWFFGGASGCDYSRRTAKKLGLRHYCEPALAKDGQAYVVMQVCGGVLNFEF